MLEYVLFHQKPFELFVAFLKNLQLEVETNQNDGVYEIRTPDGLDNQLAEKIETEYDLMMQMNHELFVAENPADSDNYRMATVMITLQNGDLTSAHIPPDILGRVLEVIDEVELNKIITAVVTAVENPDERSYCQKVQAGDVNFDGD